MSRTTLNHSTAGNYGHGGAIFASTSIIIINASTLYHSITGYYGYGGAIYAGSSSNVTVYMSTFRHSTARYGGAIYCSGYVEINNVTFDSNTATTQYGRQSDSN